MPERDTDSITRNQRTCVRNGSIRNELSCDRKWKGVGREELAGIGEAGCLARSSSHAKKIPLPPIPPSQVLNSQIHGIKNFSRYREAEKVTMLKREAVREFEEMQS